MRNQCHQFLNACQNFKHLKLNSIQFKSKNKMSNYERVKSYLLTSYHPVIERPFY